ncbi:MAG TPA: hypothetical protein VJJ23_02550 [Candidatus Nanoarchaeia archaeon]|nr:hypothetical protein [Candidatus Nanoarchaeia archaeon]
MEFQKQGFKEKKINKINEKDFRVNISGFVINKFKNGFVLDDGTGQIIVISDENVKENDYLSVIGIVDKTKEIRAEIVIDFNNINKKLHRKIIKMMEG